MKGRVLQMTSMHAPRDVRVYQKECLSLSRAGYDVTLVAYGAEARPGESVKMVSPGEKPPGGFRFMTVRVLRHLRCTLREKADLFHFHDPELIPAGLFLRLLGRRVVYDAHEDFPRQWVKGFKDRRNWPEKKLRRAERILDAVENFAVRRFSAVVAATPAIAEKFKGRTRRCVVVQNFPELREWGPRDSLPWSDREKAVTYVGGLSLDRGAREMVRAAGLLGARYGAKFILAGSFSPADLGTELRALPGWDRVEALGFLDREGVRRALARSRVGWVVLHPEPRYQVAYPVKLFEYMAAGIPVVASDFPLWRGIVESAGCGLLADPLSAEDIAEKTGWLLGHPSEAEAMGRRGRDAVEERYNWASEESKLLGLYDDLLRDKKA